MQTTLGLHTPEKTSPAEMPTRTQRLKAATQRAHAALDERIMASQPFANRKNYSRFLRMQYCFHRDIEALYDNPALRNVIVDLQARNRMESVAADLHDLNVPIPNPAPEQTLAADIDLPVALGWLYVAEGSKLGAAILLRLAGDLSLSELFGARHLSGHADGRARHWREFTSALDNLSLSPAQDELVVASACAAFDRVRMYAEREFSV